MNMRKNPVLLIFGYPLNFGHFGGLVWIKRVRVTDYIQKNNLLSVRKVSFVTSSVYNLYTSSSEASPLLFDSKSRNSFIVFLLIQNITYLVSI